MGCPCEGLTSIDLVKCLAPPPGEYEVEVKISESSRLVVNEEGFFIKRLQVDESLPFVKTPTTPVPPSRLASLASIDDLLCRVVRALSEAASHGSLRAKSKLRECGGLVASLLSRCGDGEA